MSVSYGNSARVVRSRFSYGWVVVATGAVLMATSAATINSFGVFFKPLAADFGWSRATTSGVQSGLLVCMGIFSIAAGWLADRFGPARVFAICGSLAGLGLMLTSQVNALWQIYLTYSIMTGIGLCSTFAITATATARWFVERRGLALGITTAGVGLGNLLGVPGAARLLAAVGWSRAYFFIGVAVCVIMIAGAFLLRRSPEKAGLRATMPEAPLGQSPSDAARKTVRGRDEGGVTLSAALRTRTLWLIFTIFLLFTFCNQMLMVHLVNYATDVGITPLVAATLISGIGLSGTIGRILMGIASDRIGNIDALIVACLGVVLALVLLVFARELWMLYLFTIIYGFAYGAEIPQQPALVGKFFGLRIMLVGILHSAASIGGAMGSWVGGQVFDVTQSYYAAFLIAGASIVLALLGTLFLRSRYNEEGRLKARSPVAQ